MKTNILEKQTINDTNYEQHKKQFPHSFSVNKKKSNIIIKGETR